MRHSRPTDFARALGAASALAAALAPSMARAQSDAGDQPPPADSAPPAGNNVAESQEHLARALEFFRNRQYPEAIHEFELANRAAPSADFLYNIARCHELLSHYDEAVQYYRRYLRDKVDAPNRAQLESHIGDLERLGEQARLAARAQDTSAHIRFEVATPGAQVYLAPLSPVGQPERAVGRAPLAEVLTVPPSSYALRVTADGMQEWHGQLRARQGETVTAYVTLQPETRYRTVSGSHIASYILAGATVVSLGAGAVFGVQALSSAPCPVDTDTMMATGPCPRRDQATTADVLFAVGAGLALVTAVAYLIESGSSHTERIETPAAPPPAPAPAAAPAAASTTSPAPAATAAATTSDGSSPPAGAASAAP